MVRVDSSRSDGSSCLPEPLSGGTDEKKMADDVSVIRRGRYAELELLRNRKSLKELHDQFSSLEGYNRADCASAALTQKIQEERRKDLEKLRRDGSSSFIKTMHESLSTGNYDIVSDLDEFYLGQRKAKVGGHQKEVGTWGMLKTGGNDVVTDLDELCLGGTKDEGHGIGDEAWDMHSKGGNGLVYDMGDFYLSQGKAHIKGHQKEGGGVRDMCQNYKAFFVGGASKKNVAVEHSDSSALFSPALSAAPSAASTDAPSSASASGGYALSALDYKNVDFRGFVFVVHPVHGLMLLHCTRKKSKGPHFQLPGGHIDDHEFEGAAKTCTDPKDLLLAAAKAGAARELYEETGMDVRKKLERLRPATLRSRDCESGELACELKKRLYFFLEVEDSDFWTKEATDTNTIARLRLRKPLGKAGSNLMLKLSVEHSGFTFELEPQKSAELLKKHSGGKGSQALLMAMARDSVGKQATSDSGQASEQGRYSKQHAGSVPSPSSAEYSTKDTKSVIPSGVSAGTTSSAQHETAEASIKGRVVVGKTERYLDREDGLSLDLIPQPKRKGLFACFKCCS